MQFTSIDTATAAQIADIIEDHVGADNAVSLNEIMDELEVRSGTYPSFEQIDDMVHFLVVERHLPIGEIHGRYFYIETREELDEYVHELTQRIDRIADRRDAVKRAIRLNPAGFEDEDQATLHTFEE